MVQTWVKMGQNSIRKYINVRYIVNFHLGYPQKDFNSITNSKENFKGKYAPQEIVVEFKTT